MVTYKTINITEARDLIKTGKVILADIRDRESYMQSHIPDAVHLTEDNLEAVSYTHLTLPTTPYV